MIGGIMMIFVAVWVYQSVVKTNVNNVLMWVGISVGAFFIVQILLGFLNVYILESIRGGEADAGYERALTSIGDRKDQGGFQGAGGFLLSIFFELVPPLAGFLVVALIRTKLILKEKISITNLFSGLKELFQSIKQSFKTADK